MKEKIEGLLRKNNLSITGSRYEIISLFLEANEALDHAHIERVTGNSFDRATIYRTLHSFVEKGLIHLIPTKDNSIKYALCKDDCKDGHHQDNHVHFICNECSTTVCLDKVIIPKVKLPKGYTPQHLEMVVNGICKDCR